MVHLCIICVHQQIQWCTVYTIAYWVHTLLQSKVHISYSTLLYSRIYTLITSKIHYFFVSLLITLILCRHVLVEFLPWRGVAKKHDMLRNLAHIFSTCFKQIQEEMISQWQEMETKALARWKQVVIFDNIYESGFLPTLRSLDLDWHLCLGECSK